MSRLQAWIWRDATLPRHRFRRFLPLPGGWNVEVLYPFGWPRWFARAPWTGNDADRGWCLRLPFVARSIAVYREGGAG